MMRMGVALAFLLMLGAPLQAAEQRIAVAGKPGYLNIPAGARAGGVLVSGAGGMSPRDLLMRTRGRFAAAGLATLMISFDTSPLRAVQELRRHVPRVGLVAMSAGTLSAARAVANGAAPDRLVLISGFLSPGAAPNSVRGFVGTAGRLPPTLVIHNRQDACAKTPAGGVEPFIAWSHGRAHVRWISSTGPAGDPCGPMHYHGFPGSEGQVVQAAAGFVLSGR